MSSVSRSRDSLYRHFTLSERREIAHYLQDKHYSLRTIARLLVRSVSSISREVRKNQLSSSGEYAALKAHHKAYVRRRYARFQKTRILSNMKLRTYIEDHLRLGWSPQEVSGRIAGEIGLQRISKSAIYEYLRSVHGQLLAMELDLLKVKKRAKSKAQLAAIAENKLKLADRIFIDHRPTSINERLHYGDYEGDFIVSGKNGSGALLVLHERKSRFVLIRKLSGRTIEEVHAVFERMTRPIKSFSSLTLDNDIAFRRHGELSCILKAPVYFCHAYHSWEKGGVEFSNRLIREYIPKGSDISQIPEEYILDLEVRLNNRPRKILQYKTPLEVMQENEQFHTFADYPCTTKAWGI